MAPKYEDEDKIIWLKDHDALARMGYVREKWILCPIRTGPVKTPPGEMLIGYAVLKKTAAKSQRRGLLQKNLHPPARGPQSGDRKSEDRFCESKDAFRDFVPLRVSTRSL